MSDDSMAKILGNTEILISLLGRIAFKQEAVREIVTQGRKDPGKLTKCYNACDGTATVTDIADVCGILRQHLSPILAEWQELGILYEVEKPNGRFYKKLFPV